MKASGYIAGSAMLRKLRIGATLYAGSAVFPDSNKYADIIMCTANSAANAYGFTHEAATYSAASPGQYVLVDCNPFVIVQGDVWAGTTKVNFSTSYTTQVLLQDTASSTTLTDTAASDLDYTTGILVPLTGTRAGEVRTLTTQTDSTSVAVTVPYSGNVAVGDYALRTYGFGCTGVELVGTYFDGWNNLLTTTEAIGDSIGEWVVWDVIIDDQSCAATETGKINIKNGTAPKVQFRCIFEDHAFNTVAVS